MYSKHVEDIYWNKFRKKVHLVVSYYAKNFWVCATISCSLTGGKIALPRAGIFWRNAEETSTGFVSSLFGGIMSLITKWRSVYNSTSFSRVSFQYFNRNSRFLWSSPMIFPPPSTPSLTPSPHSEHSADAFTPAHVSSDFDGPVSKYHIIVRLSF